MALLNLRTKRPLSSPLNEYTRSSYLSGGSLNISNEVYGRLSAGLLPMNRGLFAAELIVICLAAITVAITLCMLPSDRART